MAATASTSAPSASPRGAARVVVAVAAIVLVFALAIAGIAFLGLAIAFPIAVPVAEQLNVPIKVGDAELARRFAGFWWAFAAASVVSFVAAIVVAVKAIGQVSPVAGD